MSRRSDIDERIASIPMFSACTKEQLRQISRLTTPLSVPAGKVLTREGAPGSEFVIILTGTASVTKGDRRVATLGPGDYFGEIALLDAHGKRTATVTAETPMDLEVISRGEFGGLLEEVPALSQRLLVGMAHRLADVEHSSVC